MKDYSSQKLDKKNLRRDSLFLDNPAFHNATSMSLYFLLSTKSSFGISGLTLTEPI